MTPPPSRQPTPGSPALTGAAFENAARQGEEVRYARQRDALIVFDSFDEDEEHAIRRWTETAAKTLDVARVSVWRYSDDRSAIRCVDLYELTGERHSEGLELPAAAFPAYFRALAQMDVISAHDAQQDARTCEFSATYLRPLGITSMLDAPIRLGGVAAGVLCHEHIGPARHWTTDEETFAVAVANRVSLALEAAERRWAEEELRRAHEQLEQMLAHSAAILYRLKVEGHHFVPVTVSANITRILGFSTAEVLHAAWWAGQLHPEDRERAMAGSSKLLQQSEISSEYRVRHKEGGYRWIEDHRCVVRDADGFPVEIIGVWQDITERKQAEATLEKTHQELIGVSRQAGMAEVATTVLHNVGNVLNSVNVSATLAAERLRRGATDDLARVVALLQEHASALPEFFATDPRGAQLPGFLGLLHEHFVREQTALLAEMDSLVANVGHIKEVVAMQQGCARATGVLEVVPAASLLEDSLRLEAGALERHGVQVVRAYDAELPPVNVDKHKALQVLVNLLCNAQHALDESTAADKCVTLRVAAGRADSVLISVTDNGVGIPAENLTRIFEHGFTTRRDGHGFGLHSGALAAREMGGSLTVLSAGPGHGATFTLELPNQLTPS